MKSESRLTGWSLTAMMTSPRRPHLLVDPRSLALGRRSGHHLLDDQPVNAGLGGKLSSPTVMPMPGVGTPLADQLGNDAVHHLGRYRKADAGIGAGGREDRRVDADGDGRRNRGAGRQELPGLIAASVWMTSASSRPSAVGERRFSALMMPVVRVWSRPNGLPMAKAHCDLRSSGSPRVIGGGDRELPPTRSTARS